MKWVLLFSLIFALLFGYVFFLESCSIPPVGRNTIAEQSSISVNENQTNIIPSFDKPKFTIEEILAIAKKHSPDCRIQIGIQNTSGCKCSAAPLYVESESIYEAVYAGKGVWVVTKTCSVNPAVFSRNWYFYESSEELVIKND